MHNIDQKLMLRFAEWMMAHEASHSAGKLLKAVQGKGPAIGAHIRVVMQNAEEATREAFQQDFTLAEQQAILAPMGAQPKDISWEPLSNAERQRRRATALDDAAQKLGFETWRRFETAVANGTIEIEITR